jgi:hypothetical protein
MDAKQFITTFNVKSFIDAQRQFYEYDFSIDSEDESIKEWEQYVKATAQNKAYEIDSNKLINLVNQENKNNKRWHTRQILDKTHSEHLNDIEFRDFTTLINCEYEIEQFKDRVTDGIKPQNQIIEECQKDIIDNLNLELLKVNQYSELPISKDAKTDLVIDLSQILFYQYLENQKPLVIEPTPSVIEPQKPIIEQRNLIIENILNIEVKPPIIEPTPSVNETEKHKIKSKNINQGVEMSANAKMEMLKDAGFFESNIIQGLNTTQIAKMMISLFGSGDLGNIRRYVTKQNKESQRVNKEKLSVLAFSEKYNKWIDKK